MSNIPIYKFLEPIQRIENLTGQFITVFIWSALYFAYHFFEKSRNQELSNLQLEAAKQKAALSNLKSQMNPHFMFNSLNNIRALVDENPLVAKKSINELSNLLRASFNFSSSNLIPLREELKLVEDYLSLEKIRFENRLEINLNVSKEALSFLVPPMFIQTLVENGVKHGISKIKNGGLIDLTAKLETDFLIVTIVNDGVFNPKNIDRTGTGIVNSKKRIELQAKIEGSVLITGIPQRMIFNDELKVYNSAIFLRPDGFYDTYQKIFLVPFAEYVPFFKNWLSKINQFDDMGSFSPGQNYNTFDIGNVKSSIMICYDSSSFKIAKRMVEKGAEIIFVITNDSYVGKAMPYQHFEHAKLRSIELGIPVVQSANNGISGIILPSGEVLIKTEIDERNVYNYSIKLK